MLNTRILCRASLLLLCLVTPTIAAGATPATITALAYQQTPGEERIIITCSQPVAPRIRALDARADGTRPFRLFIDCRQSRILTRPRVPVLPRESLVTGIRCAQFDRDTVRVVFDLRRPIKRHDYTLTTAHAPDRLILTLRNPDLVPQAATSAAETIVVAIDAGHGGKDPGAVGHRGLQEKEICLRLARMVKTAVDRMPGFRALLIRDSDQFVKLDDRGRLANRHRAHLFISIHANAHADHRLHGFETYYLNFSSDDTARKVAARENFTTPEQIGDLEMILFDLMHSEKINRSSLLAGYVHKAIARRLSASYTQLRDLGIKHAPMRVLVEPEMPCILIESGFITNRCEARRLQNADYLTTMARAISEGLAAYSASHRAELAALNH